MKELIKGKVDGLCEPMKQFGKKLDAFKVNSRSIGDFNRLILEEMQTLGFDSCASDRFDNTIGVIKGYSQGQDIALIFHVDYPPAGAESKGMCNYKPGIMSALYTAAALKRSLLPLVGDILVCGVPRSVCCEFGVKYLFDYYLKKRLKKLKGIILCEPTDMNIYLGHKGRMEYEIVVKVRLSDGFLASRGINMLGTMFPLIHELETVSQSLPSNYSLGNSSLKIKDVHFCGTQPRDNRNEFRVIVDRSYVPEEQEENILERAKMIAKSVYKSEPSVMVQTAVAMQKIKTFAGANIVSEKEIKPWTIEGSHPFILNSHQALKDNGFKAALGYWQKTITAGSYTFGELGIPTLGFGPEAETLPEEVSQSASFEVVKKAVFGQAIMIQRNIGVPTFGWTSDEI